MQREKQAKSSPQQTLSKNKVSTNCQRMGPPRKNLLKTRENPNKNLLKKIHHLPFSYTWMHHLDSSCRVFTQEGADEGMNAFSQQRWRWGMDFARPH